MFVCDVKTYQGMEHAIFKSQDAQKLKTLSVPWNIPRLLKLENAELERESHCSKKEEDQPSFPDDLSLQYESISCWWKSFASGPKNHVVNRVKEDLMLQNISLSEAYLLSSLVCTFIAVLLQH